MSSILIFQSDDREYGVPAGSVYEIIKAEECHFTQVPGAEGYIAGVISHRSEIMPVVDFRARLGRPDVPSRGEQKIIVFHIEDMWIGLKVDSVSDMVKPNGEEAAECGRDTPGNEKPFVSGSFEHDGRAADLLDLNALFMIG